MAKKDVTVKEKVTYDKVLSFRANAQAYVRGHGKEMNKFIYALTKMVSRTNELEKQYQEEVNDIRIDSASVDEKGNLISKEVNNAFGQSFTKYEFTPAKLKDLNKKVRDLGKKEVEVEPYICTGSIPEDVNFALLEEFYPFVIDKLPSDPEEELKPFKAES